jgi:hypothetical protein
MSLSIAKSHAYPAEQAEARHRALLFKEDRPRRIDRIISFFGDGETDARDRSPEPLVDSFGRECWSER